MPLKNPEVWLDLFRPATGQKLYLCKIFIRFLEKFHPLVPRKPYGGPQSARRAAWVFIVIRKRIGYDYQLNKMPSLEEQEI